MLVWLAACGMVGVDTGRGPVDTGISDSDVVQDPGGDSGPEGDADVDADTDGDADVDADADGDTAVVYAWYVGTARLDDGGDYVDGTFGISLRQREVELCRVIGALRYAGEAELACPECVWSFTLRVEDVATSDPEACAALGVTEGLIDGLTGVWSFAEADEVYGNLLRNVVWYGATDPSLYLLGYADGPCAYSYGDRYEIAFGRRSGRW